MYLCFFLIVNYFITAYPAVYGQFPQAIPQPMTAVAPTQREGKEIVFYELKKKKKVNPLK